MRIFADSATDLPLDYYTTHHITLIPLKVIIDGTTYEDWLDITPIQVYDTIRSGGRPTTAQASLEQFIEHWTQLAERNEEGLYIAFSSELSGTYATAEMARRQVLEQYPQLDLTIVDSKAASLGYGLLIEYAKTWRDEGMSRDEIAERLYTYRERMTHLFTVDDLDYLAAGGRVSKASAFVGSLLNIKPLLHVENGQLIPLEKIRGRKKLLHRMVDIMERTIADPSDQIVGISHGDDLELAEQLQRLIEERLPVQTFKVEMIGATIASHTGPGTVALFFLRQPSS